MLSEKQIKAIEKLTYYTWQFAKDGVDVFEYLFEDHYHEGNMSIWENGEIRVDSVEYPLRKEWLIPLAKILDDNNE